MADNSHVIYSGAIKDKSLKTTYEFMLTTVDTCLGPDGDLSRRIQPRPDIGMIRCFKASKDFLV